MRQQAATSALQGEMSSLLQKTLESGNAKLLQSITTLTSLQSSSGNTPHQRSAKITDRTIEHDRRGRHRKVRISLPRWFANCVGELVISESQNIWTFQLHLVNIRPRHTYAFDFVRQGNLAAVRELMSLGDLSVNDQADSQGSGEPYNLLHVSALCCSKAILIWLMISRWQPVVGTLNCAGFCYRQLHFSMTTRFCVQRSHDF